MFLLVASAIMSMYFIRMFVRKLRENLFNQTWYEGMNAKDEPGRAEGSALQNLRAMADLSGFGRERCS
jgi:hypothetical protein